MGRRVSVHEEAAGTGRYDTDLRGTDCQYMPERFDTLLIIEISDKDYRSFCWPCHALEDTGDYQSES